MSRRGPGKAPVLRDWHLWSAVARSTRPLRPDKTGPAENWIVDGPRDAVGKKGAERTAAPKPPSGAVSARTLSAATRQRDDLPLIEPRMRRRLVRGRIPIDATLDLHGMRQTEAHKALVRFVTARAARGDRTVLVITGKGVGKRGETGEITQRGVLRSMLPRWLAEPGLRPFVAGFEAAAQEHGGGGAFYVRLRPHAR